MGNLASSVTVVVRNAPGVAAVRIAGWRNERHSLARLLYEPETTREPLKAASARLIWPA
jgi:hypothetical protein